MKGYAIGLYEKAMPPTLSWREKLTFAKEAGYDFVEISIDEKDEKLARLDWTADQRLELVQTMKEVGLPMEEVEKAGIMMPVISVECRYKVPAKLGDTLKVVSIINEMPRAKLVIENQIFNPDGHLVCEGSVVLGFINSRTRRPVRCPEALVEIFSKHIN